jgi:elongation factor Ts
MSISAEMVRHLREETGAGMMDCKSALVEAKGDAEAARELLRKKGLAAAARKAGRSATEGAVGSTIAEDGRKGAIVEVNCETDFVAKTDDFQGLVRDVADHVARNAPADVAALAAQDFAGHPGTTVGQAVQEKIALIKENIVVRRFARFERPAGSPGVVASYIHPGAKVGVLVEVSAGTDASTKNPEFQALVKDVAMHVAAASPAAAVYVSKDQVPAEILEKEKDIYRAQAAAQGKPANVVDRIAEGKLKEYYQSFCLLEQPFVKEAKITLGQLVEQKGKALSDTVAVVRFARFRVGEGSGEADSAGE